MNNQKYICRFILDNGSQCNKEISNEQSFSKHVQKTHKITLLDYKIKYENFEIPKCPICNENAKQSKIHSAIFAKTCGNENCIKEVNRRKTVKYLLSKTGQNRCSFNKRKNKEPSYLEAWFANMIKKHSLESKFDIICEFLEYPYFIDFAFVNIRFAVELNGKHHFVKNTAIYTERHQNRQKYLESCGWKVFNIDYFDIYDDDKIKQFLEILDKKTQYVEKKLDSKIYKLNEYNDNVELYRSRKNNERIQNINELIKTIDITKRGWLKKIREEVDKNISTKWIKKFMPHIAKNAWAMIPSFRNSKKLSKEQKNEMTWKTINDAMQKIDFTDKHWHSKLRKITGVWAMPYIKKYDPKILETAWSRDKEIKEIEQKILKIHSLKQIDFEDRNWAVELSKMLDVSPNRAFHFVRTYMKNIKHYFANRTQKRKEEDNKAIEQKDTIIFMYSQQKNTIANISKTLKINERRIKKILNENNIKRMSFSETMINASLRKERSPNWKPENHIVETRSCACGCGRTFECTKNKKKIFIHGHNTKKQR
jgi:very-short-patch-repair endonuclease